MRRAIIGIQYCSGLKTYWGQEAKKVDEGEDQYYRIRAFLEFTLSCLMECNSKIVVCGMSMTWQYSNMCIYLNHCIDSTEEK